MDMNKLYGLSPMSFKDELNAPIPVREIRNAKVEIIDNCNAIIRLAEAAINTAKRIPEDDDAEHAALVDEYVAMISKARILMIEANALKYK